MSITPERIAELREWLTRIKNEAWNPFNVGVATDLLALLDEYERARPLLEAAKGLCENRVTYGVRLYGAALEYRKEKP